MGEDRPASYLVYRKTIAFRDGYPGSVTTATTASTATQLPVRWTTGIGDQTRERIFNLVRDRAVAGQYALTVREMAVALDLRDSSVRHHLHVLEAQGRLARPVGTRSKWQLTASYRIPAARAARTARRAQLLSELALLDAADAADAED
jgi:hypothetical protein